MSAQFAIGRLETWPRGALPRGVVAGVAAILLVGLILADARVGSVEPEPRNTLRWVGEWTGTTDSGVPIYRFPPVQITATRSARAIRPEMLP